jgi:hypothetical protein
MFVKILIKLDGFGNNLILIMEKVRKIIHSMDGKYN